jgi:hypothetical protein
MSRRIAYPCAGLVAIVVAVAVVVLLRGEQEPSKAAEPAPAPAAGPAQAPTAEAAPAAPDHAIVLVRRRGGLPPSWIRRLRTLDAVEALTEGSRTQWLLRRSQTAGGRRVDAAPAGHAIPLDTYVVDPRGYARVTGEAPIRELRRGRVLLSESSARLRRLGEGDRMTLAGGRTVRVAGVVPDGIARDAELVVSAADVPREARRSTVVLVATRDADAVARAVPDDRRTRVAQLDPRGAPGGTGNVIRAVAVKARFGEFAARLPYGADWIDIDPRWVRRTIVTRSVPILGTVTCHRRLIAPLRRALGVLQRRGLSRLVDPGDYAGCYAPRRIPDSGSLSLHAWGLAVDINASENHQGSEPRQDPRVVRAFERAGFTWGGRWPTAPDGMHFELHE